MLRHINTRLLAAFGTIIYYYDLKNRDDVSPSFARCLLFGVLSATTLGSSSEGPTTPGEHSHLD